jgi:hypothetical protein
MAITAQKLLPQKTGGAIAPIKKSAITKITPIATKKPVAETEEKDTLVVIKERCIEIDTLLKGSLALEKIRDEQNRKKSEKKERAEGEKKLEATDDKGKKKGKGLNLPKISFFDRIKDFITNVLLGFVVVRLLKFAPQLAEFLKVVAPIADFILDIGGKLFDGLVTLVTKGYELYDSGRKFIGDKLGEDAVKKFDEFSGAVNTMLNLALIAAMATAGGFGRKPKPKSKTKPKPKPGQGIDAKSGRPRKPKANEIIDPDGKIRAKKGSETKLKNMGLDDDQIRAYNKARDGGANASQAISQARKVKPKPKAKPRGFFGRIGQGFADFGTATKDLATKGAKALGGGLNYLSGGNLGKLGNFLQDQYKNASKFARGQYDRVAKAAAALKGKVYQGIDNFKKGAAKLADNVKQQVIKRVIEPLKPIFEPILAKLKPIGEKIMSVLRKIPGFDMVEKILKKNGIKSIGDAKGLLKKLGGKAIPIIGGIVNLLFAYDRLAQGDLIGGILEGASGVLDLSGAFGFVPGPGISLGIDAYMFARDFIPQIQETEGKVINGLGLGGIKTQIETLSKKLPDLSTIVKGFTGGDPNKPIVGGNENKVTSTDEPATTTTGIGPGSGANVTGASGKGMQTGPAGYDRIGAGAAYHVDTKFHKSIGMNGMIAAMDKMADAYTARGKEIVFSGQGPARLQAYKSDLDQDKKQFLLSEAIKAHSHSTFMRAEGFKPFDYYIPDISANRDLYHSSTEGAEILLPQMGGEIKVGSAYGGYGKSAEIFDASGKMVAMTGHGDLAYAKGGFTKAMAHRAILGEEGKEFVLDADSTAAIEGAFPGLLSAANKAKGTAAIEALKSYASYDMPEVVPVPVPASQPPAQKNPYQTMKKASTIIMVKAKEAFNDILYMR